MKSFSRGMVVLTLTTLLTHCGGQQTNTPDEPLVRGAITGTAWSSTLNRGLIGIMQLRPSALLGIYVSDYLIHTSTYQGAIAGIEAQMQLLFNEEYQESESFKLLEELGGILQVDVNDMMNRSSSRAEAFNTYVDSLGDLGELAENHVEGLRQELDTILDERRVMRRETTDIQRELNNALREQDYASAGGLQQRLIESETKLAGVESREDEQRSVVNLFEDLLEIAQERLNAMNENREALIAGIKVIEVPGVDDLGILEQGRRVRTGGSGFDRNLIDPYAN